MQLAGFVDGSYTSQTPWLSAQRTMNWYVERVAGGGARAASALYPCPGFTTYHDFSSSWNGARGAFTVSNIGALPDRLFFVIQDTLLELDENGDTHNRATLAVDQFPCTFATNGIGGNQLMFTSGGVLYNYDLLTNTVTSIATFTGASIPIRMVDFLDGFFLALDATNSAFYTSDLEDGTAWDLARKNQRTAGADPWIAMKVILRQIWLLGTLTSEVWADSGAFPDPFAPIPGAFLEVGIVSGFSLVNLDSSLVWVGRTATGQGQVYRSNGYIPVAISTEPIAYAISTFGDVSNCECWAYQDQGHSFAVITFPNFATKVYDTTTNLWHDRGHYDQDTASYAAYRPSCHTVAFGGQHFVGDRDTGNVFTMSIDVATDVDGGGIRRERRSPYTIDADSMNMVFYPGVRVDLQTGVGLVAGQIPQCAWSWSDDGGQTFPVEIEQTVSAGAMGEFQVLVDFLNLGMGRARVWKLVCADPVPWRVFQVFFRPPPLIGTH